MDAMLVTERAGWNAGVRQLFGGYPTVGVVESRDIRSHLRTHPGHRKPMNGSAPESLDLRRLGAKL
jgi:hypothetical protein